LQGTTVVVALACAGLLGTPGHVVRKGETLATIARKHGVSVAALAQANGIKNPNVVYAGRTLVVPGGSGSPADAAPAAGSVVHTVRAGENLAGIASRYGTTVSALVSANGIKNPNVVVIGRTLTVATAGRTTAAPSTGASAVGYHVVRPGDSVASIARRYGVSADQLRAANGIVGDKIYNGGRILLAPRNTTPLPATPASGTHVVRAGETLAAIAGRYRTTASALASSNGIKNPNRIVIGRSLQVPSTSSSGFRCPVPGASFMNDWGFPRSGGRFHEGNDLFAARGTPVQAPASGVVTQTNGTLGGHQAKLTADDGTVFYGMHLDRFGKSGRVAAGDIIGYVGDTGDARGGRPHLHFEVHPGGGSAINPYPSIIGRC
jgi:LysM repeat protein